MLPAFDEWVSLIWDHTIIPLIQEQFFGDPGQLKRFDLDTLKERARQGNENKGE